VRNFLQTFSEKNFLWHCHYVGLGLPNDIQSGQDLFDNGQAIIHFRFLVVLVAFTSGFDAVILGRYSGGSLLCGASPARYYAARRALSVPHCQNNRRISACSNETYKRPPFRQTDRWVGYIQHEKS
jgi:hypothetical protein